MCCRSGFLRLAGGNKVYLHVKCLVLIHLPLKADQHEHFWLPFLWNFNLNFIQWSPWDLKVSSTNHRFRTSDNLITVLFSVDKGQASLQQHASVTNSQSKVSTHCSFCTAALQSSWTRSCRTSAWLCRWSSCPLALRTWSWNEMKSR